MSARKPIPLVPVRAARALHHSAELQGRRMNAVCVFGGAIAAILILSFLRPDLASMKQGMSELHLIAIVSFVLCIGAAFTPFRDPRYVLNGEYMSTCYSNLLVISEQEMREIRYNMGLPEESIKAMGNYVTVRSSDDAPHNLYS